jgi:F-type H+-transporting ATPase subunit a
MTRFLYAVQHAAAPAEAEPFDIKEMILHHLADSNVWEAPWGEVHFRQLPPVHLGPITLNFSLTKHVLFMMIAAVLVAVIVIWAARDAKRQHAAGAARGPKGTTNVVEAFILFLRDEVALRNIGHGGERYVPYVITVFFFILFCNLLGLLPWGASPTGNISVTATLALMTFIIVEVTGMRELGAAGYSRTIFYVPPGLPVWMKPIMLAIFTPVEIIGKLTKPFALTIRLYANMTAGHAVVLAFTGMLVLAGIAGTIYVAPAPILMAIGILVLEIFVAFLQAYIFAMLSSVFIGLIRHAH